MHTYIDTYEREGLLNPVTVGLKETICYFRLEHIFGQGGAKRVSLLPYPVLYACMLGFHPHSEDHRAHSTRSGKQREIV